VNIFKAIFKPKDDVAIRYDEPENALKTIIEGAPVVLITGRAGTGKTTLIRNLIERDGANQVVLAPTGVAAMNVGGQTIHSFFRIPPRMHNLNDIQPRRGGAKLFKNLRRIIIDEISMVRADLLDAIDHALKINRLNQRPFGGVQVVLVGDFLQLPPIVREDDAQILENMGYETPFAFSAKCLTETDIQHIELSVVHRQNNPEFIRLLGNLRAGEDVQATIETLNETCLGDHKRHATPVILTATNAVADKYNVMGLKALPSPSITFEGVIAGEFKLDKDKLPVTDALTLKVGARIMMAKNDPAKKWVNGSLGTITRILKEKIWVKLDDKPDEHEVSKASWENIRYEWDAQTGRIEAKVVGSYTQIPVIPAWALTIHKAQGLTLDHVRIDLERGAFASGQAYVALSRARSLEGLSFATPLRASDIKIDHRLVERLRLALPY
jgi:ATP-dependent DNA helicase PIF1